MKVVIDIPDYIYCDIQAYKTIFSDKIEEVTKSIINGILLPKVHGRLIDADELTKEIKGYIIDTSNLHYDDLEVAEACNYAYYNCLDEIEDGLTIIEEESED